MAAMKLGFRAGLVLATSASVASAGGGTRKVDIESEPPGAAVYLDSVDKPAVCAATPCTIEAPIGTSVVILRKDGYEPEFGQLSVPKKGKVRPFKFSLAGMFGTLVVDDARYTGATITVDDVNRGIAPQRIDVEPKTHQVVIALNNKELFAGKVAVEIGATVSIPSRTLPSGEQRTATEPGAEGSAAAGQTAPGSKPAATGSRSREPAPRAKAAVEPARGREPAQRTKASAEPARGRDPAQRATPAAVAASKPAPHSRIAVGIAFDVNFRQFRYLDTKRRLPTQVENGQDLIGPTLEVWPMALLGASRLRGLSLYGEFEFGLNHLEVINDANGMTTGAKTKWRKFAVDLRHVWAVGNVAITPHVGFVRDQMNYSGDASTLPIGDYQAVRGGVTAKLRLARSLAIYGAAEARLALDTGPLGERFGGGDVYGGRAAAGISGNFGPVFIGLEGSARYYRWSFSDTSVAGGARDVIESIALFAGAQY